MTKKEEKDLREEEDQIQIELTKRIADCRDFAARVFGKEAATVAVACEIFDRAVDVDIHEVKKEAFAGIERAAAIFKNPTDAFEAYDYALEDGEVSELMMENLERAKGTVQELFPAEANSAEAAFHLFERIALPPDDEDDNE